MTITLRNTKGSALSYAELDGNFTDLEGRIAALPDSAQVSGIITADVDSAYINARVGGTYLDSAEAQAMIDSNLGLQTINDSATVQSMIDSNLGAVDADFIPLLDSTYDLGSSTKKWKDLHLSGTTIHLGGQTISNQGGKFNFSQELSTGANNVSVNEGNGFFVNLLANVTSSDSNGVQYGAQASSLKLEGNTIQFATVDGPVAAEIITNQGIFSIGDSVNGGGTVIVPNTTIAQRTSVQGLSKFKTGAIIYQTDSNHFEFYDSDGWQKFIKLDTLKTEVAASADFAAFKTRIAAL